MLAQLSTVKPRLALTVTDKAISPRFDKSMISETGLASIHFSVRINPGMATASPNLQIVQTLHHLSFRSVALVAQTSSRSP
jgi:hypothetical protein